MRENVGRGGRKNNDRTAWQRIVGYLASRGTRVQPHLTLVSGAAQYVKGAVGYGCVGLGRGISVQTPEEEERSGKDRRRGRGCTWGDYSRLETFKSRFDWTNLRNPQAASTVPTEKAGTQRIQSSCRCYAFGCKCERVAIRGEYRMARGWRCTKLSLSSPHLRPSHLSTGLGPSQHA